MFIFGGVTTPQKIIETLKKSKVVFDEPDMGKNSKNEVHC